ncbi:hypothetical protein Cgig2_029555 [Carnegiea gigantea]|uniref:Uncharacterized protein n=1 Tax=Carnegiea gigantea TaxID=171969 RepID=A0A9Q1QJQ7_9CARY|nr:hypothetical protein Cgig2_029555 [Carnegiea gigantea]
MCEERQSEEGAKEKLISMRCEKKGKKYRVNHARRPAFVHCPEAESFFIHLQRCLNLFPHPRDPRIGGLGSSTCRSLTDEDRDCGVIAVKEYQQKVNHNTKLKLRDLMKVNLGFGGGVRHYITFSAEDEMAGEIDIQRLQLETIYITISKNE